MKHFESTCSYKLIYIISMPYEPHKGLLKIGEASIDTCVTPESMMPNCHALNQAALARIKGYTGTASVSFNLLYTELAVKGDGDCRIVFRDHDVHSVLQHSGVHKVRPNGETGNEWFRTSLDVAKNAIKAVKEGRDTLTSSELYAEGEQYEEIELREEQAEAISDTIKMFKNNSEVLWHAKMRFGKTLTALELVRQLGVCKTIIITHRPVVIDGWGTEFKKVFHPGASEHDYLFEYKTTDSNYEYDEKIDSENDAKIRRLVAEDAHFIYFASIQDLRESSVVNGKYNKNNAVFAVEWDLVIVDEAHEGTQTELGGNVVKTLRKSETKLLALSGTPFNLLSQYDSDNIITWDYVMEQKKKELWEQEHFGDHNPYADMPKMHIYTYDLGDNFARYILDDYGTKAFNFREFFKVWSRGPHGKRAIPEEAVEGNFVHEDDISSFLNLLTSLDDDNAYPFSTEEHREMFRHTLWMVPGVKEALALSRLLRKHPVFGNGKFGIANVAGKGDLYEKEHSSDALKLVRDTIKSHRYSITLSCGKLTTGVTVKEWTAVFMLSGSYSTSASQYMQTIFRVQSAGSIDGKQKTDCFVFDFAPDRALKVLTETVHLSRKPGKSQYRQRELMKEFINYCPVIAISGSRMNPYSVNTMMEQIKQVYAERAVNSGFEDESIYSDELLKLTELDASKFNELRDIIGTSRQTKQKTTVVVSENGLTDEQIERIDDDDSSKSKDKLTPEQIAKRKAKEARKKAIDILNGISIRMPLMIYGMAAEMDEDVDIERFVELVDEKSWAEFMPQGVTKQVFSEFIRYYDRDVFVAAGKRIRKMTAAADRETPTKRVQMIAEIFRRFKNPDKETVLTPWRVVNLHMSDTVGGWCFFNEQFEDDMKGEKRRLEEPRFVDQGDVTHNVFREDGKVLEINSKTGLYPLYIAYSFYRQRLEDTVEDDWEPEELAAMWAEAIQENVYVVCKTPMAKAITNRTLSGFSTTPVNTHYFDDLVNMLINKPEQFRKRVLKGSYWKKEVDCMIFDAIVGNPPYQEETAKKQSLTNGQARSKSVFQYFQTAADEISSGAVSLIYPGARWIHRSGRGMERFGYAQINDARLARLDFYADAQEVFPDVAIADGISVVYKNKTKGLPGFTYVYHKNGVVSSVEMMPPGEELIPLNPRDASIISKVTVFVEANGLSYVHDRVLPQKLFGIESSFVADNSGKVRPYTTDEDIDFTREIKLFANDKAGKAGRTTWFVADRSVIEQGVEYLNDWKVVVSSANAGGQKRENQLGIIDNHSAFGRSRVALGSFKTKEEAENFFNYSNAKLIRFTYLMTDEALTSLGKKVPDILDYTSANGLIDFSRDIDEQLYALVGLTEDEIKYVESVVQK